MANLNAVLRQEISRIARREIRTETRHLKSASATYRRTIAALKRQLREQARVLTQLKRNGAGAAAARAPDDDEGTALRFRAGGVAAHRKRLGLSAENFARLVGVTGQTVYNWERGKRPRAAQLKALGAIRTIGKREALVRLEALAQPKARTKRSTRPRRKR